MVTGPGAIPISAAARLAPSGLEMPHRLAPAEPNGSTTGRRVEMSLRDLGRGIKAGVKQCGSFAEENARDSCMASHLPTGQL